MKREHSWLAASTSYSVSSMIKYGHGSSGQSSWLVARTSYNVASRIKYGHGSSGQSSWPDASTSYNVAGKIKYEHGSSGQRIWSGVWIWWCGVSYAPHSTNTPYINVRENFQKMPIGRPWPAR